MADEVPPILPYAEPGMTTEKIPVPAWILAAGGLALTYVLWSINNERWLGGLTVTAALLFYSAISDRRYSLRWRLARGVAALVFGVAASYYQTVLPYFLDKNFLCCIWVYIYMPTLAVATLGLLASSLLVVFVFARSAMLLRGD
jgi:hypothetical protein